MKGVKAQRQNIDCRISYKSVAGGPTIGPVIRRISVTATNAVNQTYSSLESLTESGSEGIPVGLAADYYAARSVTPWAGTVERVQDECTRWVRPGSLLNISGGNAAWTTMDALVQTVEQDLQNGRTVAGLGPPEHLAPQDLLEQQRMMRRAEADTRARATNAETRQTGTPT